MSSRTLSLTPTLHRYLSAYGVREPESLVQLRLDTEKVEQARMQISPEQGQLMRLLVELMGVRGAIEVGTFTGYSALCVALALPSDGKLVCCDIDPETTALGRAAWDRAGVGHKIDLRIAPAADTLRALLAEGTAGQWDLVFIDADKPGYDTYYELALELLRPGGLVCVDNVLWGGAVADLDDLGESTVALRALNEKIHGDPRVTVSMVPIGDGLTLARKR